MAAGIEDEIHNQFAKLSVGSQLNLLERLVHQVRITSQQTDRNGLESDLAAMAADPDVQREIAQINKEFRASDNDGLTNS